MTFARQVCFDEPHEATQCSKARLDSRFGRSSFLEERFAADARLRQHASTGIHVLAIESGLRRRTEWEHAARALRRAVMARVQDVIGEGRLSAFYTGHEADGTPARGDRSTHLAHVCDFARSRLLVIAPHVLDRRECNAEEGQALEILDCALDAMRELRAGPAGRLVLRRERVDEGMDPLIMPSVEWESVTPYTVTRHVKLRDAAGAFVADLVLESRRRGLPAVRRVKVLWIHARSGTGLAGKARLEFAAAVRGPVVLGRTRYLGGGLFCSGCAMRRPSK
jgi:CRISPR-associated protein Csb2